MNRHTQQGITDILRNTQFAGDVRPRIVIQTVTIDNHEIYVLIIKDSFDVPYYLKKEYQDKDLKNNDGKKYGKIVRPYHLYTRVADNNTPIDKQADVNDIEFLCRKRFGIELPIKDRINILLDQTDKWIFDWGNKKHCYHLEYPEFQIIQAESITQGWALVAAFYTHPIIHTVRLNIVYHSTVIYGFLMTTVKIFQKQKILL